MDEEWIEPWIGVDLDGCLAYYDGWKGVEHIGPPIPEMVERVKKWIADGENVKIFTARCSMIPVHCGYSSASKRRYLFMRDNVLKPIEEWCETHLGTVLEITCRKDMAMRELWDDRAVSVEFNTGKINGRNKTR